jgi:hypothetical protein
MFDEGSIGTFLCTHLMGILCWIKHWPTPLWDLLNEMAMLKEVSSSASLVSPSMK